MTCYINPSIRVSIFSVLVFKFLGFTIWIFVYQFTLHQIVYSIARYTNLVPLCSVAIIRLQFSESQIYILSAKVRIVFVDVRIYCRFDWGVAPGRHESVNLNAIISFTIIYGYPQCSFLGKFEV